jgi:hypothetical protein
MNVVSGGRDSHTPINPRKSQTFSDKLDMPCGDGTGWLPREDSNCQMTDLKSPFEMWL